MKMLIVGHATLDSICDRRTQTACFDVAGGAAIGAAVGAAVWDVDVTVLSVIGHDYPPGVLAKLGTHGVTIDSPRRIDESLRFWILRDGPDSVAEYPNSENALNLATPSVSDFSGLEAVEYDCVHICPMGLRQQLDWLHFLAAKIPFVSIDPQPARYSSSADFNDLFGQVLALANVVSISPNEFPEIESTPISFASQVLASSTGITTLKYGAEGSVVAAAGSPEILSIPALHVKIQDEAGAGDVYAASFLANLVGSRDVAAAAIRATATAATAIREYGVAHVLDAKNEIGQLVSTYPADMVTNIRER